MRHYENVVQLARELAEVMVKGRVKKASAHWANDFKEALAARTAEVQQQLQESTALCATLREQSTQDNERWETAMQPAPSQVHRGGREGGGHRTIS